MIDEYVEDALTGEDRDHAQALLNRRAPWRYWLRTIGSTWCGVSVTDRRASMCRFARPSGSHWRRERALPAPDMRRCQADLADTRIYGAAAGRGGSHEQWVKDTPEGRHKVTVDCPKAPFSPTLIASMARQAGVSKAAFYDALDR